MNEKFSNLYVKKYINLSFSDKEITRFSNRTLVDINKAILYLINISYILLKDKYKKFRLIAMRMILSLLFDKVIDNNLYYYPKYKTWITESVFEKVAYSHTHLNNSTTKYEAEENKVVNLLMFLAKEVGKEAETEAETLEYIKNVNNNKYIESLFDFYCDDIFNLLRNEKIILSNKKNDFVYLLNYIKFLKCNIDFSNMMSDIDGVFKEYNYVPIDDEEKLNELIQNTKNKYSSMYYKEDI